MLRTICIALVLVFVPSLSSAGFSPSYQNTGNLGMEIAGAAGGNTMVTSGNLTLTNVPVGATILHAWLYATQSNNSTGLDASFNGNNLGTAPPFATDPGLPALSTYGWNVLAHMMPGVLTYSFSVGQTAGGANGVTGVALVVVWSHPSEPNRTIVIQHGMQQVGESGPETESMSFSGLPSGSTKTWVFTVYDDATSTSGESIDYNAVSIGGPFVANLGLNASVLSDSTGSVSGTNTLALTTGVDHLGWVIGAVAVDPSPTPVEATTWGEIKRRHLSP